ncbi:MAG TPA: GntR family transcriptional regulator [Methylovirgula sp.]|nr:GntR family transcriptional regulator [Methylovirgula sp.]
MARINKAGDDAMAESPLGQSTRDHEIAGSVRDGRSALSVTDRLREAILGGEIATGVRLNEVRLSQMMEVSRTPVRAALQALAGEGLLDYVPNRGFLVRTFPLSEIVDAYEIRAQLEGLATRFAAERGLSEQDRHIIEQALADGDALLAKGVFETGDMSRYRRINGDIHDTILGAAKNRMLGEMIRICHHVPVSSNRNIVAFEYRYVRRRHDDHHRIYEAILAREPHRAEALMREHIAGIKSSLVNSLRHQAPDTSEYRTSL